jgi:glycosyltransferase involved in cell wall biosynthesis
MTPARILFVHNQPQSFVRIDLALLRERWQVEERFERRRQVNPAAVWASVQRADLVFCWFASWHSLLPVLYAKLQGKPSVLVVGGYDTANIPRIAYGSQRGGARRRISRLIIQAASHLIVNSESARLETVINTGVIESKITVIYHGVEPIDPPGAAIREQIALTVGGVWRENLYRKGLLPFVQAAKLLPEWRFIVAGKWEDGIDTLREAAGNNVTLTGFLNDPELAQTYRRASVYVQASLHEGFGMSLAEAMSAGCIPVGTHLGAIPEVIGDTGVYTEPDPESIASAVVEAHQRDREQPRERILTQFPIERRRSALHALIERCL